VEAYAARWAVEHLLHFTRRSELGVQSLPRAGPCAARGKLLGVMRLAYAFTLDLLGDRTAPFVSVVVP
jgi:hypothetical protein